jgi:hypothetical protein
MFAFAKLRVPLWTQGATRESAASGCAPTPPADPAFTDRKRGSSAPHPHFLQVKRVLEPWRAMAAQADAAG